MWNKEVSFTPLFQTPSLFTRACNVVLTNVLPFTRKHPEWWAAIKTILNLYNLPRIIGQNLNFQPARKFQASGCPKYLGVYENFFNLSKVPEIIGPHKNPKMPKTFEQKLNYFQPYNVLGQHEIPKLPKKFQAS